MEGERHMILDLPTMVRVGKTKAYIRGSYRADQTMQSIDARATIYRKMYLKSPGREHYPRIVQPFRQSRAIRFFSRASGFLVDKPR